jgi:hypothetical protein
LAQFQGRFRTKLAHLEMKTKKIFSKMCKLNAKSRAKFDNVNAPLMKKLNVLSSPFQLVFSDANNACQQKQSSLVVKGEKLPKLKNYNIWQ